MKVVNKIKTAKVFINEVVTVKQQEKLINEIKDAFCRIYKLNVKLHLTGEATYKAYEYMDEHTYGYFLPNKGEIVLKVSDNVSETVDALTHELIHAYQYKHLRNMFMYGVKQQETYGSGCADMVYYNSVHEQHARLCAKELTRKIMKNKNNIRNIVKSYDIDETLHKIDYTSMAV